MKRILFVMIVLFVSGMVTVSAQQREASITVAEAVHDFGQVQESGGAVSHVFTVLNNGELPLVISRVVASCGCTIPEWTKEPIAPGKTGDIKVSYNPTGQAGPFTKTISVYSNGKAGNYVLTIKGEVKK
ncbi:MAG: DUF1573 domain-containing protein [Tannerella sp.]|nr:DUF1573 domain-containing protein [Tannerella sp.]